MVVTLPNNMPWPMAQIMFDLHGKPPWTDEQIAVGRAEHVASRTDRELQIEEAIGYANLRTLSSHSQ